MSYPEPLWMDFHLLVKMHPEANFSDDDIKERFEYLYGKDAAFPVERIGHFRKKGQAFQILLKT